MKNRDENTTIILFSYKTYGFFERFFNLLTMNVISKKRDRFSRSLFILKKLKISIWAIEC
jgi:hypothetical protein